MREKNQHVLIIICVTDTTLAFPPPKVIKSIWEMWQWAVHVLGGWILIYPSPPQCTTFPTPRLLLLSSHPGPQILSCPSPKPAQEDSTHASTGVTGPILSSTLAFAIIWNQHLSILNFPIGLPFCSLFDSDPTPPPWEIPHVGGA